MQIIDESEFTEEQISEMTPEQLVELEDKEEVEEVEETDETNGRETSEDSTDTSADNTDETKPEEEDHKEEKESEEEGYEKSEEFKTLDEKARGFYFDRKKAIKRAQEAERLIETERNERIQRESIIKTLHGMLDESKNKIESDPSLSETDKVTAKIAKNAEIYEAETGEQYRLTWQETQELDRAKEIDRSKAMEAQNRSTAIQAMQRDMDNIEINLRKELSDDGIANVQELIDVLGSEFEADPNIIQSILRAKNPVSKAKQLIRSTEQGFNAFLLTVNKKKNKEIIESNKKKITKTSAHNQTSTSGGVEGRKITVDMLSDERMLNKLTQKQIDDVFDGKVVYA